MELEVGAQRQIPAWDVDPSGSGARGEHSGPRRRVYEFQGWLGVSGIEAPFSFVRLRSRRRFVPEHTATEVAHPKTSVARSTAAGSSMIYHSMIPLHCLMRRRSSRPG